MRFTLYNILEIHDDADLAKIQDAYNKQSLKQNRIDRSLDVIQRAGPLSRKAYLDLMTLLVFHFTQHKPSKHTHISFNRS